MKRIDDYIESIYKNMKGDPKEIDELKIEMKTHLLQTIEELEGEGKSEDDSIEIAIERFGDKNQLENELTEVFKVEIKHAKVILMISIVSLIVSVISFIGYKATDNNFPFQLKVPTELKNIKYKLEQGEGIANEDVTKILEKYKKQFRYVALLKENSDMAEVVYPSGFSKEEIKKDRENYLETYFNAPDGCQWRIRYGFIESGFYCKVPWLLNINLKIFLTIYWVGFSIWCMVTAYNKKKLSIAWIIIFLALNIVGYIMFLMEQQKGLSLKSS